jgi:superfamily II DNA or RNA helicase
MRISKEPTWTGACSVYPYDPGLDAALVFDSKFDGEVRLARRDGDVLLVPRGLSTSTGKDVRVSRPLPAISCKVGPLDVEQANVIASSLSLLRAGTDHVVEAPTGFGKTYVGASIAAGLGQVTIILVQKDDLMGQWRDTLLGLVGVGPDDVGVAKAAKLSYEGKRFVLGSVQSVIRSGKYDSKFFESFGLVVFDEIHRMAADCFSKACFMFPAMYRLGLSATPKRPDGKTPVVEAHVGPVLVRGTTVPMRPKVLVKNTGWVRPEWSRNLPAGSLVPVAKAMAKSPARNAVIVEFVVLAYARGRRVVVMSELIDHLEVLRTALIVAGVPPQHLGTYTGALSGKVNMLRVEGAKPVVLATYRMCSEGTNFPLWDTLVMATPKAHVKQPLGRILRASPGKPQPVCLELLDHDHPDIEEKLLRGFHYSRLKEYYEVGAEVVRL